MPTKSLRKNKKKLESLSKYFSNGLPNVYIKKAIILGESKISFLMCMNDRLIKSRAGKLQTTWFTNLEVRETLNYRIIQVTSETISKIIDSSKTPALVTKDLYDIYTGTKKKSSYFKNIDLVKRNVVVYSATPPFNSDKVVDYLADAAKILATNAIPLSFEAEIPFLSQPNYLCYYAQCVATLNDSPKKYGTPTNPTKVKVISRKRQLSADPRILDFSSIQKVNDKIIKLEEDYGLYSTEKRFKNKKVQNLPQKKLEDNYNSDIFLTKNTDGTVIGRFFLDVSNILRNNSLLSSFLDIPNNDFVTLSDIKEIKIKRRRVSVFDGENSLGTATTSLKEYDSPEEQEEIVALFSVQGGTLVNAADKEKNSSYSTNVTMGSSDPIKNSDLAYLVSFDDKYLSLKRDGTYQYGFEIEMDDMISKNFAARVTLLKDDIKVLSNYHQTVKEKYDSINKTYKNNASTKKMDSGISQALERYSSLLYDVGKITNTASFNKKSYKASVTKTGTERGILSTIAQMKNTENELAAIKTGYLKIYDNLPGFGDTLSVGGGSNKKKIVFKTYFKTTIEKNINFTKLDFLGSPKLLGVGTVVSSADIIGRARQETSMYFTSTTNQTKNIGKSNLNIKDGTEFLNLEKNQYTYFTAAEIQSDKSDKIKRLNENLLIFDKEKYTLSTSIAMNKQKEGIYSDTSNISDKNKRQLEVFTSFLDNQGATIEVVKKEKASKDTTTPTNLPTYFEEEESKLESNRSTTEAEKTTSQEASIKRSLSNMFLKNDSPTVLKSTYDLQSPDNGINKLINKHNLSNRKDKSTSVYSQIPNQIKSLFLQEYGITNKDWQSQNINISENTEYTEVFRNNYSLISKLVFLSGFKRNKKGENMYNKPIYSSMTGIAARAKNKTYLCKFEIYENSELGVGNLLKMNYDINNEYFMFGEPVGPILPATSPPSTFLTSPARTGFQAVGAGQMPVTAPKARGGY